MLLMQLYTERAILLTDRESQSWVYLGARIASAQALAYLDKFIFRRGKVYHYVPPSDPTILMDS